MPAKTWLGHMDLIAFRRKGFAERALRQVKDSTAAALVQASVRSGLPNERWNDAMECYFHLTNVHDTVADGKQLVKRRFTVSFDGSVIPRGPEHHMQTSQHLDKDEARSRQMGAKDRSWNSDRILLQCGERRVGTATACRRCGRHRELRADPQTSTSRDSSRWKLSSSKNLDHIVFRALTVP